VAAAGEQQGHPQAFVRRRGVNAGRGASAKVQKADVVLSPDGAWRLRDRARQEPDGGREGSTSPHQGRRRRGRIPCPRGAGGNDRKDADAHRLGARLEAEIAPMLRDYIRAVWRHAWWLFASLVGGVLTIVSLAAEIRIDPVVGLSVLVGGIIVAQFLAWRDMRARHAEIGQVVASEQERRERLIQARVLKNERVRFTDLLPEGKALIEFRRFEDCEFVGPAPVVASSGNFDACTMPQKPQGYWRPLKERKIGVVVIFGCEFVRCRFTEQVGFVIDPDSPEYEEIAQL
jgi:hypothetical protein